MSRGPYWTKDEKSVLQYLWDRADMTKPDAELDEGFSKVLKGRDPDAIRFFRLRNKMVRPKKVDVIKPDKIVKEITKNPRADSLPDVGEQVAVLIDKQTKMEATLWAINTKMGELIELQKAANAIRKDELDLWRTIDARSKAPK